MATGIIKHDRLGVVTVTLRTNSSRISARWKNGRPHINVPPGTTIDQINRFLDTLTPRLLDMRPEVEYFSGQRLDFPGVSFEIRSQSHRPGSVLATPRLPLTAIEVGTDLDFANVEVTATISRMLCSMACRLAPRVLLPRANELARTVGRIPAGWVVSKGHRTLGRCNERGVIALSCVLVFLPSELRDYVILHEIAHLSEMNHSPAFHALLDSYLGGREQTLTRQLKAYKWPILRK